MNHLSEDEEELAPIDLLVNSPLESKKPLTKTVMAISYILMKMSDEGGHSTYTMIGMLELLKFDWLYRAYPKDGQPPFEEVD